MTLIGFWELPDEDSPPEEFYGNDEALKEWFDSVKARRKEQFSRGRGDEPMEEVPQMTNEALREMFRG